MVQILFKLKCYHALEINNFIYNSITYNKIINILIFTRNYLQETHESIVPKLIGCLITF